MVYREPLPVQIIGAMLGGILLVAMFSFALPPLITSFAESGVTSELSAIPGGSELNNTMVTLFYAFGIALFIGLIAAALLWATRR